MAQKKGGLLSSLGGAMVTPREMRAMRDQHYVAEYDYEKDRYRQRKEYEYERRVREMEEQLRHQMRINQPRSAQEAADMQRRAAEQLQMAQNELRARAEQDMAMAYPGRSDTNYFAATSGSNYTISSSSGTGSPKKKKSNKTNWDRPIIGILQDETDEWLKDALKAA